MKISQFLLAALAGVALAGTASAQSTLRIIGAQSYRSSIYAAVERILNPGFTLASSSSLSGTANVGTASAAEFAGTLVSNDDPVVIKTFFTGAVSGVADLASQRAISGFVADGLETSSGTGLGSGYSTDPTPQAADVVWTDESTGADASALLGVGANANAKVQAADIQGATFTEAGSLGQGFQGLGGYVWMLESTGTTPAPFNDINQQNAASLIHNGYLPLIAITGNTNDELSYIFLIGRNEDAGARLNVFAEAQTGIGNAAVQWQPTFGAYGGSVGSYKDPGGPSGSVTVEDGGTNTYLTALAKWPANWKLNSNTTVSWSTLGHSGFVTSSEVAAALEAVDPITTGSVTVNSVPAFSNPPSKVYVVGYVGTLDAAAALTSGTGGSGTVVIGGTTVSYGPTELSYNGVLYSQAAVQNGQYSVWGYEHSLYLTGLGGDKQQAADDIADAVYQYTANTNASLQQVSDTSAAGILYQSDTSQPGATLFSRGTPGGLLTPRY